MDEPAEAHAATPNIESPLANVKQHSEPPSLSMADPLAHAPKEPPATAENPPVDPEAPHGLSTLLVDANPPSPSVRDQWMWEFLLQDRTTPYAALTILGQGRFRALAQDPALNRLQLLRHLAYQLDGGRFDYETLAALGGLQDLAVRLEGTPAWRPVTPSAELCGRVRVELSIQHLRKDTGNWPAFQESLTVLFPESIPNTKEEQWGGLQSAHEELWAFAAEPTPPTQEKLVRRYPRAPLVAALRAFLAASWGAVGPPYLQLVADDVSAGRFEPEEKTQANEDANGGVPPWATVTMKELLASFPARDSRHGPELASLGGPGLQRSKKRRYSEGPLTPHPVGSDPDEAMPDLPSPERVDAAPKPLAGTDAATVVGELRESSQALRRMGEDPLPAVLAEAGGARSTRKTTRAAAAAAANSEGAQEGAPEEGEGGEPSPETLAQRSALRGKAKISLMDRQEGARTLQWTEEEDPIESTPEAGSRPIRLPSTEPREPIPQKIRKSGEGTPLLKSGKPRRETNPWRPAEEEALIKGVREFGEGKWKRILTEYEHVFVRRTGVDLKDKWRTRSKDSDFR